MHFQGAWAAMWTRLPAEAHRPWRPGLCPLLAVQSASPSAGSRTVEVEPLRAWRRATYCVGSFRLRFGAMHAGDGHLPSGMKGDRELGPSRDVRGVYSAPRSRSRSLQQPHLYHTGRSPPLPPHLVLGKGISHPTHPPAIAFLTLHDYCPPNRMREVEQCGGTSGRRPWKSLRRAVR